MRQDQMQGARMEMVYKILTEDQNARFAADERFDGAPVDHADGYIHLSTRAQAPETLARHFADQDRLVLVALDVAAMGEALRWEPSRGGALFPHLYGPMTAAMVRGVWPLGRGPDGLHALPDDAP